MGMKELLSSMGLDTGKKDDMIKALLKHEAKARKELREHETKIRSVVLKKKNELEGKTPAQLSELCVSQGIKGIRSKEERIQTLLRKWQEDDGVDQALTEIAWDERKDELVSMDNNTLRKLCGKLGVDPYVKEIMVERLSKQENASGRYSKPLVEQKQEESVTDKKLDMVEALLENESRRKQEKALKAKRDETVANKMKEMSTMSIEELKKALTKKGLEPAGKREEMIKALFAAAEQAEALALRRGELKSMGGQELKALVTSKGLEASGKSSMVDMMLNFEAKCRADLEAFNAKGLEVLAEKKEKWDAKSNGDLKEMCASKGLAVGGGKEERIERLLEEVLNSGEVDKAVSTIVRNARKMELMAIDKPALLKLSEAAGVDALVKEIMVERIIMQESEDGAEPPTKKARR